MFLCSSWSCQSYLDLSSGGHRWRISFPPQSASSGYDVVPGITSFDILSLIFGYCPAEWADTLYTQGLWEEFVPMFYLPPETSYTQGKSRNKNILNINSAFSHLLIFLSQWVSLCAPVFSSMSWLDNNYWNSSLTVHCVSVWGVHLFFHVKIYC